MPVHQKLMANIKILVVTGRNHEWCKRVGDELEIRQRKGQIPAEFQLLVVDDPKCSVGSGGATLNALLVTVENLSARLGHHIIHEGVLTNSQIFIVHTGRLFEFCALERLFSPLPLVQTTVTGDGYSRDAETETYTCVFDYLIDTLLNKLAPAYANGVWVCSSDMLLCVGANAHTFLPPLGNEELLAISVLVSKRYARNHGVFILDGAENLVTDIEYQPMDECDAELQSSRAGEKVPVVTGVVYLTPAFAAKLLDLYVTAPIDGCTYAGLDSGSPPVRLNLFLDVLLSLCRDVNQERFLAGDHVRKQHQTDRFATQRADGSRTQGHAHQDADSDLDSQIQRQARTVLWKKLRGAFRLRCAVLHDGFYQHLSVTASEYMRSLRSLRSCVAHFDAAATGSRSHFTFSPFVRSFDVRSNTYNRETCIPSVSEAGLDADAQDKGDTEESLVVNSVVHDVAALRGCVVLNCVLEKDAIHVGPHSLVNGLRDADGPGELAARLVVQAFHVRLQSQLHRVLTVFGTGDRLFVNANSSTFCGQPFDVFCARTGLQPADLWPSDCAPHTHTLFLAKLFPVDCVELRGCTLVQWFAGGPAQPGVNALWRNATRLSLHDVLLHSDLHAEFEAVRDAFYAVAQRRMRVVLFECHNADLNRLYRAAVVDGRDAQLVAFLHALARDQVSVEHPDQLARAFANIAELLAARARRAGGLRSGPASNREWAAALRELRRGAVRHGVTLLESEMNNWCDSPTRLVRAARHYEAACQIEISKAVRTACAFVRVPVLGSPHDPTIDAKRLRPDSTLQWITAETAARIDLAGGWSDTPPICYELGGAVCNVGVLIDGRKPIGARARLSSLRTSDGGYLIACRLGHSDRLSSAGDPITFRLTRCADLRDYNQPHAVGALLKACLVYTRTVELFLDAKTDAEKDACNPDQPETELTQQLERQFGSSLEFEMWSELPAGSGLGGSSILIAAVLAVLWRLRGVAVTLDDVVHGVLNVEQLMTTGGGWQDQVGAVVPGGVKIGRSSAGLPLHVTFESVSDRVDQHVDSETDAFLRDVFQPRLMLIYTGKTRLARNLLQDVLRNWYARDETIYATEKRLIEIAEMCFAAFRRADLATVGQCVNEYWRLKKIMAPGSEPERVTRMIQVINEHTLAASLCGAGGGGFLFVLLREPADRPIVLAKLRDLNIPDVSVHEATIDFDGLLVR